MTHTPSNFAKRIYEYLFVTPAPCGYHTISNRQLAEFFRCSPEYISSKLKELEDNELIHKRSRITSKGTERQIYLFDAPKSKAIQLF
jgi:DNA-binding transcriptional regulator YhcF (GntR family)